MKILVVTPFAETEWSWFGEDFGYPDYEWSFLNLDLFGKKQHHWFISAIKASRKISKFDLVITHTPYMSLYLAFAMKLLNVKKRHFAYSFNHGNGRFFKGPLLFIAKKVFPEICGFVVYSKAERVIYSEKYDIPINRISFTPWAVGRPEIEGKIPAYIVDQKPYACCVGRNNRDFNLFIDALKISGYKGILVCRQGQIDESLLPDNIILKTDISMNEALHVMNNAYVNVVPILDASTGAGHMTIVSSMHMGQPQIISRLETLSDYFIDREHGLFIDVGNASDLKSSLKLLFDDKELRNKMSIKASEFSSKWLSEEYAKECLLGYLYAIKHSKPLPLEPTDWNKIIVGYRHMNNIAITLK